MKQPIALLFANLKGNLGDFAILDAMLREAERRYPGHPLHVFPHRFLPVDDQRVRALRDAGAPAFEVAGATYHQSVEGQVKWLRSLGLWRGMQNRLVEGLTEASSADAARFRDYRAVLLAGGDHWSGINLGISMLATLSAVARYNGDIEAFPFSVNKLTRFNRPRDLRRRLGVLKKPIPLRDRRSKEEIQSLGLNAELTPDCVYSLEKVADEVMPMQDRAPGRIILSLTGRHRNELSSDLRATIARVRATGRPVELLSTCEVEDFAAFKGLSEELGVPYRAPLTWQEMVAEFKNCSLLVTNRLHGLILGELSGAAMLPVADRVKVEAYVRDKSVRVFASKPSDISAELCGQATEVGSILSRRNGGTAI